METILNISEAANLALHAGVALAKAGGGPLSARSMSETMKVSYDHLAKVMQRLDKAGLVTATRGPGGGFSLAKKPGSIRLIDLYEAIDGKLTISHCLFGRRTCFNDVCIMGDLLARLNDQIREHLRETRLSDLAGGPPSQEGA